MDYCGTFKHTRALVVLLLSLLLTVSCATSASSECECGYRDDTTGLLFTESIFAYFNETGPVDGSDFLAESYTHHAEKSWNAFYRQGASPQNVRLNESRSLRLYADPPTKKHVVVGGGLVTKRRDILYGTFRALIRSPQPDAGGSALTMAIQFDELESINVNLMNTNNPKTAWLSTLLRNEFPDKSLGVQYSDLLAVHAKNQSVPSPWDFMEVRVDWTGGDVKYFVNGNLTRAVSRRHRTLPGTPSRFYLRHWSTGDTYTSQGPPTSRISAEAGWGRLFFNSSLMTAELHKAYDRRCVGQTPCSVEDWNLRKSSTYDPKALLPWRHGKPGARKRVAAIVISSLSVLITVVLIFHAVLSRRPWQKWAKKRDSIVPIPSDVLPFTPEAALSSVNYEKSFRERSSMLLMPSWEASTAPPTPPYSRAQSRRSFVAITYGHSITTTFLDNNQVADDEDPDAILTVNAGRIAGAADETLNGAKLEHETLKKPEKQPDGLLKSALALSTVAMTPEERVDYHSGLLVICAFIVTAINFALTFVPALMTPYSNTHYIAEVWARKLVGAFFLNFIWVGLFITISARSLAATYLRDGNLEDIARKAASQVPRYIIPVIVVTLIEYFLINTGTTRWLQYLSSLTWSDWPFTSVYSSFANWITEVLELMYLVPNSAPAITYHYCTGVLWLIPVLLQFSWTILLGVVIVRQIKAPWKRFSYYAFACIMNWYARSWGSFLWAGLLLADLDVSYDYKRKLATRRWISAAVISAFVLLALLGCIADLVAEWAGYNFSTVENNIHPDPSSALQLGKTSNAGYPTYYIPRLSGLAFAIGMQGVIESSSLLQRVLSAKFFNFLSPHVLTIYLTHGMIFWSWGAWLTVTLAGNLKLPYWASTTVVAVTSYALVGLSLPILTPVLGTVERNLTSLIWNMAVNEPPMKRKTMYPFDPRLIAEYEKVDEKA